MNHRQLFWKYFRMIESLEKELQTTQSSFEKVELRAKISLLQTLQKENDY